MHLIFDIVVDCGDEPLKNKIENGEIILPGNNSTYYGAKIMYKCITGFTFSEGQETRTCTREGKWSGAEPKCLSENLLTSTIIALPVCNNS